MLGATRLAYLGFQPSTVVEAAGRTPVTLTAFGNAQIDTAQSEFGGASALFDGTADYIVPDDTTLGNAISSDYTFECWARSADATTNAQMIYSCRNSTFGLFGWQLAFRGDLANDPIQLFYASGNTSISYNNPSSNTWYHIAVVNSGGTITMYINGTSAGSISAGTYNASSDGSKIGAQNNATSTASLNGHIDELRISDTARYTTTFTPTTSPFINDANTLLLAHMNGSDGSTTFLDDVNTTRSAVGISAVGDAQIDTARSKFGGASGLCDGTGDHFAASTIQTTPIGTGDFTVEFWYYSTNTGTKYICDMKDADGQEGFQTRWSLTSNTIIFRSINSGTTSNIFTTSAGLSNNAWNHLAIVRNSGTVTIYHNGTSIGSGSFTKDMSASDVLYVGGVPGLTGINGNIDEVRVSDTARYTTTFTTETTPFINDTNTLLLAHMDGTDGSIDLTDDTGTDRSAVGISAISNAQIDTAQSKFGSASALFDGTDDYLVLAGGPGTDFSGDFTIEAWVYNTNNASNDKIFDLRGINAVHAGGGTGTVSLGGTLLIDNNSGSLRVFVDGGDRATLTSGEFSVNTWHHVAVQRQSGTINAWVDGTRAVNYAGSDDYTGVFTVNQPIGINAETTGLASGWQGNIDEIRISTVARYTNGASITVPTTPFTNDADTYVLIHCDGADSSTMFIDDNSTY